MDGCRPFGDFWSLQEYIVTVIFIGDLVMKFFVMYSDPDTGLPMTNLRDITRFYVLR